MNRISQILNSSPSLLPYDSFTGRLFRRTEELVGSYSENKETDTTLQRIEAVVVYYLVAPVACTGIAIAGVITFLPLAFIQGKLPLSKYFSFLKVHLFALGILIVTLPIRIGGYWAGKTEWLFPIDFNHRTRLERHPLISLLDDCRNSFRYVDEKWKSHPLSDKLIQELSPKDRLIYEVASPPNRLRELFDEMRSCGSRIDHIVQTYVLKSRNIRQLCLLLDIAHDPGILESAMKIAVEMRSRELINEWVEHGGRINAPRDTWGYFIHDPLRLTIKRAISSPEQREYLEFADFLIREKGAVISRALIEAAIDDFACLEFLIERTGADQLSHLQSLWGKPCGGYNLRLVGLLLKKRVPISSHIQICYYRDIARCIGENSPKDLCRFLDLCNDFRPYDWDPFRQPALTAMSRDLVNRMISKGWSVDETTGYQAKSILSETIALGAKRSIPNEERIEFARFLIEEKKAKITTECLDAAKGSLPFLRLLAKNRADLNTQLSDEGHNLLTYAALKNRPDIVEFLLEQGVRKDFRLRNYLVFGPGETALEIAQRLGHAKIIDLLSVGEPLPHPFHNFPLDLFSHNIDPLPEGFTQVRNGVAKRDPWAVCGLKNGADQKAIDKAFRPLSLRLHPDKHRENKQFFNQVFMGLKDVREHLLEFTS